jgi:hypothetical protein
MPPEPEFAPPTPAVLPQQVAVSESVLRQRSQELGMLGKIFGGKEHAPINIPGAIVILSFLGLIVLPFSPESQSFSHGDLAKLLGSLILAALTFLGGYLGGANKQ